MSKTVEDIGTLKINLLSQAQYDAEKAGGRLADDELYLTPSSGSGVADVEVNGESVVSGGVAEITINDIPSGGTAGQVLTKDSGTDYDVSWGDQSGGTITDVTVDGTSIVDNGVAELETATQLRDGLMTATDKQKLDGVASGAEVNVQSDWNQSTSTADDYIKNKPTIPTITDTYSGTSSDGMSGKAVKSAIDALDGTISGSAGAGKTLTAFSQTDGKVSATFSNISITKSQVSDFPTIPTVNDATLTIQKNGTTVKTFTANASTNVTADITVPTDTGDLTNGAGFITGVTSTSTPTASTIAEFDSTAHMNSTDMTSGEVTTFVNGLNPHGIGLNIIVKDYSVSTTANSSVSPFGAYLSYTFVDPPSGYKVLATELMGTGSTNPAFSRAYDETGAFIYSKSAGSFTLRVVFYKLS